MRSWLAHVGGPGKAAQASTLVAIDAGLVEPLRLLLNLGSTGAPSADKVPTDAGEAGKLAALAVSGAEVALLERLKAMPETAGIPVIALSANAMPPISQGRNVARRCEGLPEAFAGSGDSRLNAASPRPFPTRWVSINTADGC